MKKMEGSCGVILLEYAYASVDGTDHQSPPPQGSRRRCINAPDGRVQLLQGKVVLGRVGARARRTVFACRPKTYYRMPYCKVFMAEPGELLQPEVVHQRPRERRSRDVSEEVEAALLLRVPVHGDEDALGNRVSIHGPSPRRGRGKRGGGRGDISVTYSVGYDAAIAIRFRLVAADASNPARRGCLSILLI